jgi:diacylglycerol kinase family enzyme
MLWEWRVVTARWRSSRPPPQHYGLPFICAPAGTRNHFARRLGVDPGDPTGALDAFIDGIEARGRRGGGEPGVWRLSGL